MGEKYSFFALCTFVQEGGGGEGRGREATRGGNRKKYFQAGQFACS